MATSLEAMATKVMMGRGKVLNKKRHMRDEEDELKMPPRRTYYSASNAAVAITPSGAAHPNRNNFNPFELLDDKIHSYILSFLLNLRLGFSRPGRDPRTMYVEMTRRSLLDAATNNGTSLAEAWKSDEELEYKFQRLSQSKQLEWHQLAKQEKIQCRKADSIYTRPDQLNFLCEITCLVSTKWRNVVGEYMNPQAPAEIITPLDLSFLKARAHSLDFSLLCSNFTSMLQEEYGCEPFPPREPDFSSGLLFDSWHRNQEMPLDIVIEYFACYNFELEKIVATEYARFLVVKCVQVIASHKKDDNINDSVLPWTEPCEPSELVKLFWQAHLLFPKQYARDCKLLLGPLVSFEKEIDYILDHDRRYISRNDYIGSDYKSKRDILFPFEEQMEASGRLFGRFGEYDLPDLTPLLFENMFQVVKVAEAIRKDDEELCRPEERRG